MAYQPKSYRKFLASTVTAAMVATVATPLASVEAANNFKDVNASAWYAKNVDYLVGKDVLKGYEDGTFKPNNGVTRAEAAKMIVAALGSELPAKAELKFKDTKNDMWYAPYVQVLVEKGIVEGNPDGTFEPNAVITRAALAKMVVKAYELKADEEANVTFPDVAKGAWYTDDILTLSSLGIVQGKSNGKFEPNATVTRAEAAAFLHRTEVPAERLEVKKPAVAGIKSVEPINDTKFEVTFGKAIDEDLAIEIEKSGERFVVYHGGQSINSSGNIQSTTINFNSDYTKAEVIIPDELASGLPYRVALIDGDIKAVASAIYTSEPVVLKGAADQPVVEVNSEQDKVVLDFKTKMDAEALNLTNSGDAAPNYEVYENDKKIGNLSDFVTGDGKWVDATTKTAVEFKLTEGGDLLAGKTYKIKVHGAVETDNGKTLPPSKQTITFKTPSISEAQPVAKIARVTGTNEITVTFDKDLGDSNFNARQITVKKPGGTTVKVDDVIPGPGTKEITLQIVDDLDRDLTYTIDLPANGVTNAYFSNASNKETTGLKAQAQKDIEITSMTAKFVQQVDNKDKADLLLTFDQRPNIDSIDVGDIVIKEGTNVWELGAADIALYEGDSTGRTIIIKDVTEAGAFTGDKDFIVRSDKTYTIEVVAQELEVDSGVTNPKVNQQKLKATTGGISVSEPIIDFITLKSANEIEITFLEDVDVKNLKASDVRVAGFEIYANGRFAEGRTLQGSQLSLSASGKKVTIKTANNNVKFVTSFDDLELVIAKETIKNASSKVENSAAIEFDANDFEAGDLIDRAKPEMVGATRKDLDELDITFTEAVEFKDNSNDDKVASQFTVDKASKAGAYGIATAGEGTNVLTITFNDANTFKTDLDLTGVLVKYARNSNVLVKDEKGNEAANQTITGVTE